MANYWVIEDDMDNALIFTNGISGKVASREAYNTVMDFDKLDKFLDNNEGRYTLDEWEEIRIYFSDLGYLSPLNDLVAKTIKRKLKLWKE